MSDRRDHARRRVRHGGAAIAAGLAATVLLTACFPTPTTLPPSALPTASAPPPTIALTPSPAVSPSPEVSPAPSPDETPATALCEPADVKASHGLVEGAAGSRLTEVVLVAGVTCALPAWPAFGLSDANGRALVAGASAQAGWLTLSPNAVYTSEVSLANWCGPEPAFPLTLQLRLGSELVAVTGGSFPDEGDLPPCNAGTTPMLSGTRWTPSS